MRGERRGVGEVVSSLSMLAVTMAILGGFSVLSLQSIRSATQLVTEGSRAAANDAGVMVTLVATQANSTGSYVWLFNYGWVGAGLSSVYLDGGLVQGWSSSGCSPLSPQGLCSIALPPGTHGTMTALFGDKSFVFPV